MDVVQRGRGKRGGEVNRARTIKQQLAFGAAIAAKLTTVGVRVRLRDALTDMETVTTSLPWQLGHGEWVVKVEGKSGGWCCSMMIILGSGVAA